MKITEALKSLENSWSREDVLLKIKKGENSEEIVNEFFYDNKKELEILLNNIKKEDEVLLSEIELLSIIESRLINKIKNHSFNKRPISKNEIKKIIIQPKINRSYNLGLFMMKWSNKFVFTSLLVISAIALTKQA